MNVGLHDVKEDYFCLKHFVYIDHVMFKESEMLAYINTRYHSDRVGNSIFTELVFICQERLRIPALTLTTG